MSKRQEILFTSVLKQRDGVDNTVPVFEQVPWSPVRLVCVDEEVLDALVLHSAYVGYSETRNFKRTGIQLLRGDSMYFLEDPTTGARLSIVSRAPIPDIAYLQDRMWEVAARSRIPCYLDAETGSLVMYLGGIVPVEKIHHGNRSENHRDTFIGVMLTRALGEYLKTGRSDVVVNNPNELTDRHIKSVDIQVKPGTLFVNLLSRDINPSLLALLSQQNILTADVYIEAIMARSASSLIRELFVINNKGCDDMDHHIKFMLDAFEQSFTRAYCSEDRSNVVFAPTTFTDCYEPQKYPFYQPVLQRGKEGYRVAVETLFMGESMPVSMLLYRKNDEHLLVVSANHPDAFRFGSDIRKRGLVGFEDEKGAQLVGELDGTIAVDVGSFKDGVLEMKWCPLILTITKLMQSSDSTFPNQGRRISIRSLDRVLEAVQRNAGTFLTIRNGIGNNHT